MILVYSFKEYADILSDALLETMYMTFLTTIFAYLIGLPLGIILNITDKEGIAPNKAVNSILGTIINIFRSVPFMILLILLIPVTQLILGTFIGSTAMIVPLTIAAAPFIARMVETSLKEVDKGKIEAAQAMGSSNFQIIYKVLLKESVPSLISGCAIALGTILGYTAMAGIVGAGGLGYLAYRDGFIKNDFIILITCVILLIVFVQILQILSKLLIKKLDNRIRK